MGLVKLDRVEELGMKEKDGSIEEITRVAIVTGLSGTDYTALTEALNSAGVPVYNSPLAGTGFESLLLCDRSVQMKDNDMAYVTLTYKVPGIGSNQDLQSPLNGVILGTTRSRVQQKKTNFYTDASGNRQFITVSYTFPPNDPDFPNQTVVQGGTIDASYVNSEFTIKGMVSTNTPWLLELNIRNTVNALLWKEGPPRTWLCTEVMWEPTGIVIVNGVKLGRYHFEFSFSQNQDTWDADIVFIDPRTSKPPNGLIPNVGYKRIPYLRSLDFDRFFGAFVEGWQQF